MIQIHVNGDACDVSPESTIASLLDQLDVTSPAIAVELNRQIQPRDRFAEVVLHEGDEIEIVTLVGGG